MFLKTMKDLDNMKGMPEFFVYGAAFVIILYPITYPIGKFIDALENRKHYKEIAMETARLQLLKRRGIRHERVSR